MTTLSLEQVIAITRCPDWPDERVEALAKRFADGITPAQIIELAEEGVIPKGDAIWLLLQTGVLSVLEGKLARDLLQTFSNDVAVRAVWEARLNLGADRTLVGYDIIKIAAFGASAGVVKFTLLEFTLRKAALDMQRRGYPSVNVWRVFRASRIVGLRNTLIESYPRDPEPYVQQISMIAYRCSRDARAEQEAQFACLKKLVCT